MKAHELLLDKTKWIQGWPARDKDGKNVPPQSAGAIKFCMLGAIDHCYNHEAVAMKQKVTDHILANNLLTADELGRMGHLSEASKRTVTISTFNDKRTTTFEIASGLLKQLDV